MKILRTSHALQTLADAERGAGRRLGLVPTMGALHEGHLALVEAARQRADRIVVSIFVNPTQFDDPGDLDAYPRTWDADVAACEAAGVDVIFAPTAAEMYPEGAETTVDVGSLARPLCGRARPGHFQGVATIVSKLLLAAKPHVAAFGEKDFQQLAVIRRMVRDLGFDVEILGVPTVREPDGVALSSRNQRLDPEARRQAIVLSRALDAAQRGLAAGERDGARLLRLATDEIAKAPRAEIDYAELRDPETLAPAPQSLTGPALLALAVFVRSTEGDTQDPDPVRLIDNRVLRPTPHPPEEGSR